jgi:hypothetical protein
MEDVQNSTIKLLGKGDQLGNVLLCVIVVTIPGMLRGSSSSNSSEQFKL